MSCMKCAERAKLFREAREAHLAGNKDLAIEKINAAIQSGIDDVKAITKNILGGARAPSKHGE